MLLCRAYFFGQPRGHKTNEVNHALEAMYIASALLQGSWNMASRVRLLWKLASRLPKEVQGFLVKLLKRKYIFAGKLDNLIGWYLLVYIINPQPHRWARGAMDNASDYGSEDSRFESWRARTFCNLHHQLSFTKCNLRNVIIYRV